MHRMSGSYTFTHQFHAVGLAAVLVLVASGIANTWFLVGSLSDMVGTPYGQVLLLKLALFALMLVLAAMNRVRSAPRLRRSLSHRAGGGTAVTALRIQVRLELVIGLAVLATVSVLGTLAPGGI